MTKRQPTKRLALTVRTVQAIPTPANGRVHVYDKTGDFGVRVESSGKKSFFWFKKVQGKPIFRIIGPYPATTLEEARDTAKEWCGALAEWKRHGMVEADNPFAKAERKTAPTFQVLVDAYVARQVLPQANRPEQAEEAVRWITRKHFAAWLDRRIDTIGVEDVLTIRNGLAAKPIMANRAVQFARRIFNWAAGKRDGKVNFWPLSENPAKDVALSPEESRTRFLQPAELARFYDHLKTEPSADLRDFLTLALSTGARKSNIFEMRWSDVSFERKNWHIVLSKNGAGYDVDLTRAALQVLEKRRVEVPDSVEFVFPSFGSSGHVKDLNKRWQEFRKRAEIPDVRIHDLRRSHGSYLAISGVSLNTIAAALGHRTIASTKVYAHLHQEAVSRAREAGETTMRTMMKKARASVRKQKMAIGAPKLLEAARG